MSLPEITGLRETGLGQPLHFSNHRLADGCVLQAIAAVEGFRQFGHAARADVARRDSRRCRRQRGGTDVNDFRRAKVPPARRHDCEQQQKHAKAFQDRASETAPVQV